MHALYRIQMRALHITYARECVCVRERESERDEERDEQREREREREKRERLY